MNFDMDATFMHRCNVGRDSQRNGTTRSDRTAEWAEAKPKGGVARVTHDVADSDSLRKVFTGPLKAVPPRKGVLAGPTQVGREIARPIQETAEAIGEGLVARHNLYDSSIFG